jgi:hypothetical protein
MFENWKKRTFKNPKGDKMQIQSITLNQIAFAHYLSKSFSIRCRLTAKSLIFKPGSPYHRVETYRDVTDRCKHCRSLVRFHVPTFFQATGQKRINCACSASLKWVVIRSSSNRMHASSNLPSMRTKKVGTLVSHSRFEVLLYLDFPKDV